MTQGTVSHHLSVDFLHPMPEKRFRFRMAALLAIAFALLALTPGAFASEPPQGLKWVATWAQPMTSDYARVPTPNQKISNRYPGKHELIPPPSASNITLRQTVLTSVGGNRVRIRLSNYFGQKPLTVDAAHIALQAKGAKNLSTIDPGSDRALTFHGKSSVTIPPGKIIASDPVSLRVPALSRAVVSLYFSGRTTFNDLHPLEFAATTAVVAGNAVSAPSLAGRKPLEVLGTDQQHLIFLLTGVDVLAPESTRVIVAIGDSITDGAYATTLAHPWPQQLAAIANGRPGQPGVAVVNAGISGNELTTDQLRYPINGMSGLKRFERDVIDQPGVTDVIVLFGANDIERGLDAASRARGVLAGDFIASLRMLADVAHAHHLRIYVGTITPFAGFPEWYTPEREAVRMQINHWIRHTDAIDGFVPFAEALGGSYTPSPLAAGQDPLPPGIASVCAGDVGLHPNDLGYTVMGTLAYNTLFHAHLEPAKACH